jgi:hypothetical protein
MSPLDPKDQWGGDLVLNQRKHVELIQKVLAQEGGGGGAALPYEEVSLTGLSIISQQGADDIITDGVAFVIISATDNPLIYCFIMSVNAQVSSVENPSPGTITVSSNQILQNSENNPFENLLIKNPTPCLFYGRIGNADAYGLLHTSFEPHGFDGSLITTELMVGDEFYYTLTGFIQED